MHKMLSRGRTALREAAPAAARTLLCAALAAPGAHAQEAGGNPARAAGETGADDHSLPAVSVTGTRSFAEKNQLPQTTAGITAQQAAETINAMGTEDMLKYLPDVLVRKRFIGDTQSPMATRTTGINASARSLIYADGVLLSTLVNNNNGNGSPHWFMVAPQQVERIDVMYGPFSAAYPGNSYGAVTEIATRMPKKLEGSIEVTGAIQHFGQYDEVYLTPLLRRLSEEMPRDAEPKELIAELEEAGAVKLERRRGMPYDYTVLLVNDEHPEVQEARTEVGGPDLDQNTGDGLPFGDSDELDGDDYAFEDDE